MSTPEKAKREKNPRRKNWSCILACGVLFCVGILGCLALLWSKAHDSDCASLPWLFYTDIKKSAFFELPRSADNFERDSYVSGRGCVIWVQFEMDSTDLKVFQDSTLINDFETKRIEDTSFHHFMEKQGWMQPADSISGSGGIEGYKEDGYVRQWVLIDTTAPNTFVVYIIVAKNCCSF